MKRLIFFFTIITAQLFSANVGWYQDYIQIDVNGAGTTAPTGWYWIGDDPSYATQLAGNNFGTVTSLVISGCDMKYYGGGADRTGGSFYYMVTSSDGGTTYLGPTEAIWTQSGIGGDNFQGIWSGSVDCLQGLSGGVAYKLKIWAKSWGTSQGDSWLNNGGDNYVATFTTDASLPVTLTSFDATNKKGAVELSWVTESEIDNLGFLIERAVDGSAFEEIANFKFDEALRGQGSTTARTDYVWVDKQVVPGINYEYILADVDINQKVVRHTDNTVRIKAELNDEQVGIAAGFKLANVAPNPFNPSTEIHFALNDDLANSPYSIAILDITGREVQKLSGLATSGINVAQWNGQLSTGNLATSGIYFARINVDNVSQVVKMTLMR